jgi:hypothetical protein
MSDANNNNNNIHVRDTSATSEQLQLTLVSLPAFTEARTVSEVRLYRTRDERINALSHGLSGGINDGHEAKVQGEPSSITATADVILRHELW